MEQMPCDRTLGEIFHWCESSRVAAAVSAAKTVAAAVGCGVFSSGPVSSAIFDPNNLTQVWTAAESEEGLRQPIAFASLHDAG